MAAATLQGLCEEAICSICLDYFKDPVTIACGHNFCRACLAQYWEGSEGKEVSCPQCRENIPRKLIIPNRQLANFVELTQKLRLQGERNPIEEKRGLCGKHQEPLKLFCKEEETPICVVCDRSKKHRNHNVVPLEEAAQIYKRLICCRLELLEQERAKVAAYKAEAEEEGQELLEQTKAEMGKTKEHFRELSSFLKEQEKLLLDWLEELEEEIARKREEHQASLSGKLSFLGGLIQELEEKCHQPPSELLQDVRAVLQSHEKKETFCNLVVFPPELKSKIQDVRERNNFLAERMKQFRGTLVSGPQTFTNKQVHYQQPSLQKANVTLDPNTAYPWLILSEDRKHVRYESRHHDVPDYPERFELDRYVLGCEGFTAGRHYWEVAVESEGFWAVGVAKKSVQRKGCISLKTENGIWAVQRWEGKYQALNDPLKSLLPLSEKLRRIQVSLSYEEGQVSFHNPDLGFHLYTFSGASFSGETLLPFFCVDRIGSLTISF
ncbi:hypothetical protein JRQ81_012305 [Phrynocephalus forsythii]|uniref:Zinc finger protein RFP-like n=1 Tax=Phrynocephalus forsythii TaxID=171643 RepID=A0A9Q1AQ09_9SAUR|nr:hypothetical protein JRQ81_012305 [Phrynocephalus forsythii]